MRRDVRIEVDGSRELIDIIIIAVWVGSEVVASRSAHWSPTDVGNDARGDIPEIKPTPVSIKCRTAKNFMKIFTDKYLPKYWRVNLSTCVMMI